MPVLIASAGHAAVPGHISHVAAAVTALIVAALIVALLKGIGRLLTPRKPKSGARAASPYSARR